MQACHTLTKDVGFPVMNLNMTNSTVRSLDSAPGRAENQAQTQKPSTLHGMRRTCAQQFSDGYMDSPPGRPAEPGTHKEAKGRSRGGPYFLFFFYGPAPVPPF